MKLEIVVYNIESALKHRKAAPTGLSFATTQAKAGTTPSFGTIEIVRGNVSLDVS